MSTNSFASCSSSKNFELEVLKPPCLFVVKENKSILALYFDVDYIGN